MKQRGEAALIPFITAGDPDLGDYAQDHARPGTERRRCHRTGHSVFRSDRGRPDDSARVGARALKTVRFPCPRYFAWCASFAPALHVPVIAVRLLQSDFSFRREGIRPPGRRRRRRRRALRRSAAGRERRAAKLDRRRRTRLDLSVVADQRRGTSRVWWRARGAALSTMFR